MAKKKKKIMPLCAILQNRRRTQWRGPWTEAVTREYKVLKGETLYCPHPHPPTPPPLSNKRTFVFMVQHILHMTSSFSCSSLVNCQPLSNSQSPLMAFEKLVYACSVQGSSFAGINRICWHPRNLNFNVFFW